ncbi:hypothetical protein B0A52_09957 [Exophiala mesophila]|uniref:Meiotically up-regulated protein Msb1/Mug8 domain-containing protein n=1 Tax=Exophiala mesophila TaxID=212818 RepID=A0A438MTZ2_EXOME|nr:hypothetical protein B0A52_09957 [Exophiala mesophila]
MPFFSKVFKSKDVGVKKSTVPLAKGDSQKKPQWSDAWIRTRIDPEEVVELLHLCTVELKSRALDVPFLLLPFRPSSDPSAARTFVRNFFVPPQDREHLQGTLLENELRMTEVMVLISVMKWCWARLPGGIVTWEVYEAFRVGEKDSNFARDAFSTFIPLSTDSPARVQIIQDFFDLLAAVAAHGKANGLGGHKLSRFAGWWAFDHYDDGQGFESGYKSWSSAADASSHLFFAYLRSLSGGPKQSGIMTLPRSLQQLLDATIYPPKSALLSYHTTKVVMIVDVVSPTPYALLRRTKHFEYRDDDRALQQFSDFDDPVAALTDECRRVLKSISSANQSHVSNSKTSTSLTDPSWSRFEDIGFSSSLTDEDDEDGDGLLGRRPIVSKAPHKSNTGGFQDLARPTTPSWADFLSSGFADENGSKAQPPILLPPDKILPPINAIMPRGQSSQSHRRNLDTQANLDPGELASITQIDMDDAFWWVWISSLAPEEVTSRKAVFGRCALIETTLEDGQWMVMEEQVKGAAPEPAVGAYIAEKKTFLGFTTRRGRLTRRRSGQKKSPLSPDPQLTGSNRTTLAPDQQVKIQQAAAELSRRKAAEESNQKAELAARRGRRQDTDYASKTNSVFTLGPLIKDEASPALQWASRYDKQAIRAKYLGDSMAGRGSRELLNLPSNGLGVTRSASSLSNVSRNKDLPVPPQENGSHPALEKSRSSEAVSRPVVIESAAMPVEQSIAVDEIAATEAAEVPLPLATPDLADHKHAKHQPAKLRKSVDGKRTSPEQKKPRVKATPGPPPVQKSSGIRRLFGTKRGRSQENKHLESTASTTVLQQEDEAAVAAARRALEGEPALPSDAPTSPPLSPNHFDRFKTAKGSTPQPASVDEREASQMTKVEDQEGPVEVEAAQSIPHYGEPSRDAPEPPRTRRDDEYDQLSRVDTNEREHADREFSTFDQGPLLDQPAFVPSETPPRSEFLTPAEEFPPRQTSASVHSFQRGEPEVIEEEPPEFEKQVNPSDRWAQIRKNAADRAARQSEEQTTRSRTETRTDDGETSGEETIESRVARIKARVAELTGNMDAARR